MELSYAALCFDLFGTLISDEGEAVAGARATLNALGATRWAIVTSAPRAAALGLIARARLPVPNVLIGADDVRRAKPSGEPYERAARALGVDAARALVIEDSGSGIDAAHAAGMDAAFVLRGRPASTCARADFYIDRFECLNVTVGDDGTFRVSF